MNLGGLTVDWRGVGRGALTGVAVIAPPAIIAPRFSDRTDSWNAFLFFAFVAAWLVAGFVAAGARHDLPYTQGALGAVGTLLVALLITVVRAPLVDESLPGLLNIVSTALFAVSFGIVGGILGARRARDRSADGDA